MKGAFAAALACVAMFLSGAAFATVHLQPVVATTPQSTAPGTEFPRAPAVLVTSGGVAQLGIRILFTLPQSGPGGTFPGGATEALAATDATGVATAPPVTANTQLGSFAIAVSIPPTQPIADNDITFDFTIVAPPATPGQKTWTGNGLTQNWSEGANWAGGVPPQDGDVLVFPDGASRNASTADLSVKPSSLYITTSSAHIFNGEIDLTGDTPIRIESASALVVFNGMVQLFSRNATIRTRNPAPTPYTAMPQIQVSATGELAPTGGSLLFDAPVGRIQVDGHLTDLFSTSMTFLGGDFLLRGPLFYSQPLQVNGGLFEVVPQDSNPRVGNLVVHSGRVILGSSFTRPAWASDIDLRGPFESSANLVMLGSDTSTDYARIDRIAITGKQMIQFGTVTGQISGVTGGGELWLWGATDRPVYLGGTGNTFTGGLVVYQGRVVLGDAEALPDANDVSIAAYAELSVTNRLETVASFTCVHPGTLQMSLDTTMRVTTGPISIAGCNLALESPIGFVPPTDGAITLIRNLAGTTVDGTFQDLPEGAPVTVGGMTMNITYHGGSGHDVALLTGAAPLPVARLEIVSGDLQSIPRGATAQPFAVRALDAAGQPVAGAAVQFHMSDACGSFAGGSDGGATSDSEGIATAPAFTAGNVSTQCANVVFVVGSPASVTLLSSVYDPANVTLAASPEAIASTGGQRFNFGARVVDGVVPLPGVTVTFEVAATGAASASGVTASAATDFSGRAAGSALANPSDGVYAIVARFGGHSVSIPVTQSAADAQSHTAPHVQDMWWSGPAENGWGLSIVQHRDKLFVVIYAYDGTGSPVWYVMPAGTWNASMTAFTGALYLAHGAPFFAYDASRFSVGSAVGTATLTFSDASHASLAYTIGGSAGVKSIMRQLFGAADGGAMQQGLGDMWWGGMPQNGWGVAVLQQYASLFSVWFTYGADGSPWWYVMPGGQWIGDAYVGHVFRTHGAPWLGATYDPAALQMMDAGTFRIHFDGDNATLEYTVDGHSGTLTLTRQLF